MSHLLCRPYLGRQKLSETVRLYQDRKPLLHVRPGGDPRAFRLSLYTVSQVVLPAPWLLCVANFAEHRTGEARIRASLSRQRARMVPSAEKAICQSIIDTKSHQPT